MVGLVHMTQWSDDDQRWHWRALGQDDVWRSGAALSRELAEAEARMAAQARAGEPDRRATAPWRTHRWSRREQRMLANVRPRFPRLARPPED